MSRMRDWKVPTAFAWMRDHHGLVVWLSIDSLVMLISAIREKFSPLVRRSLERFLESFIFGLRAPIAVDI